MVSTSGWASCCRGRRTRARSRPGCGCSSGTGSRCRTAAGTYPPLDVEALNRRSEVERGKLKAMVDFAWSARCRRQVILSYFGDEEWSDGGRRCGACDVCDAAAHGGGSLDLETVRSIR